MAEHNVETELHELHPKGTQVKIWYRVVMVTPTSPSSLPLQLRCRHTTVVGPSCPHAHAHTHKHTDMHTCLQLTEIYCSTRFGLSTVPAFSSLSLSLWPSAERAASRFLNFPASQPCDVNQYHNCDRSFSHTLSSFPLNTGSVHTDVDSRTVTIPDTARLTGQEEAAPLLSIHV